MSDVSVELDGKNLLLLNLLNILGALLKYQELEYSHPRELQLSMLVNSLRTVLIKKGFQKPEIV